MDGSVLGGLSPGRPALTSPPAQQTPHRTASLFSDFGDSVAGLAHWSISGHVATPAPITAVRRSHSADWPPLEPGAWSPSFFSSWLKLGEAGSPDDAGKAGGLHRRQETINKRELRKTEPTAVKRGGRGRGA